MSRKHGPKLPRILTDELAGLDWRLQLGSKHWKIMIGQNLVGIWPRGTPNDVDYRPALRIRSNIRHWKDAHRAATD
jgi:hypothetical protein